MINPTKFIQIAALGLMVGSSGSVLWSQNGPIDKAETYITLFRTHCLPRIASRKVGDDAFFSLGKGAEEHFSHDASGLTVIQSKDTCEITDEAALMTDAVRDEVTSAMETLITTELVELATPTAPMEWDYYFGRTLHPPAPKVKGNWGVFIHRFEENSNNILQQTNAVLALPRD